MQQLEQDDKPVGSFNSSFGNNTTPNTYSRLTFIDFPCPEAVRDRRKVQQARSHAVTVALAKKRFEAQKNGSHFRSQNFDVIRPSSNSRSRHDPSMFVTPAPVGPVGLSSLDPFETLPVNARRLTVLFNSRSSLCAGEPVFNINDAIHYQSLHSIFGSGLDDGALTAALGLTLSYAASGWQMSDESTEFKLVAMQHLRRKLSDPVIALSSATIGTVVLLLGNAYRLGELQSAKAHLSGLAMLLRLCSERNVKLSPALRRAVYWQDLFSSMFLGTDRVVIYEDFYPSQQLYIECIAEGSGPGPPSGFIKISQLIGAEIMNATADVASLYANKRHWLESGSSSSELECLDNVQAEMEGRIHSLRRATVDDMLLCCIIALHLCVYGLWDAIWSAALIPRKLSTSLLYHLDRCHRHNLMDKDLFFWLVYIGKAFAPEAEVRNKFETLWLRQYCRTEKSTLPPWNDAHCVLSKFIWSEVLYSEENGWFWERIRDKT